jgi:hypothetical protein
MADCRRRALIWINDKDPVDKVSYPSPYLHPARPACVAMSMKSAYTIKHLAADKAIQAYPLARDILGCESVEDWIAFTDPLTKPTTDDHPEEGIIVIERNDYIRGMFSYLVRQGLNGNRVLDVRNFAILEMTGGERLTEELIKGAERIANTLQCDTWILSVPKKSDWTIQHLEHRGHSVESYSFSGRVAATNDRAL